MTHSGSVKKILLFPLVLLPTFFNPTFVEASSVDTVSDYQEVSYDDLVAELHSRKSLAAQKQKLPTQTSYIGVGYVHTYSQMNFKTGTNSRSQNGLQLSTTMNLDSPNLYAEGLFRNLSGSTLNNETLQVYQFDARLGYLNEFKAPWKYSLFTGFVGRFIDVQNAEKNYSANEFAPAFTAGFGAVSEIHRNLRLGIEVSGRTSILGRNVDRDSVDFIIRLDTAL